MVLWLKGQDLTKDFLKLNFTRLHEAKAFFHKTFLTQAHSVHLHLSV